MAGQLVRGHVHARQLRHILGNSLFLAIFGKNDTNYGLCSPGANGGGVAFAAHVGGCVFGVFAARRLLRSGTAFGRGPAPSFG